MDVLGKRASFGSHAEIPLTVVFSTFLLRDHVHHQPRIHIIGIVRNVTAVKLDTELE